MSQSQTGLDLIHCLKELSKSEEKFFLPDIGREEAVARSLVDAYNFKDLITTATSYVKKTKSPIMVFQFAMEVPGLIGLAISERESREKFQDIVAKTKARMDKRQ